MIIYLILSAYFMLIFTATKIFMIHLTKRQVEKRNLGFKYFSSFSKVFIYRKPVIIVFFCVFVYGNTSIQIPFSAIWFLEMVAFMATMVIADMLSQFLTFKYANKKFAKNIEETNKFADEVKDMLAISDDFNYSIDLKNYSLKETIDREINENSHIAVIGFNLEKVIKHIDFNNEIVYLLDASEKLKEDELNKPNYKVVSKIDGYKLPFKDERLDCVICHYDLYDFDELRRVLKPNGIVIIEQHGSQQNENLISLISGRVNQKSSWGLEEIVGDFESESFKVMQSVEHIGELKFSNLKQLDTYATSNLNSSFSPSVGYMHVYYKVNEEIKENGNYVDKLHSMLIVARKEKEDNDDEKTN